MKQIRISSRVGSFSGRVTDIAVWIVFYVISVTFGLSWILQEDLVFEPGGVFTGWSILVALLIIFVIRLVSFLRKCLVDSK